MLHASILADNTLNGTLRTKAGAGNRLKHIDWVFVESFFGETQR